MEDNTPHSRSFSVFIYSTPHVVAKRVLLLMLRKTAVTPIFSLWRYVMTVIATRDIDRPKGGWSCQHENLLLYLLHITSRSFVCDRRNNTIGLPKHASVAHARRSTPAIRGWMHFNSSQPAGYVPRAADKKKMYMLHALVLASSWVYAMALPHRATAVAHDMSSLPPWCAKAKKRKDNINIGQRCERGGAICNLVCCNAATISLTTSVTAVCIEVPVAGMPCYIRPFHSFLNTKNFMACDMLLLFM